VAATDAVDDSKKDGDNEQQKPVSEAEIIKEDKPFKKIGFKISNENAWEVGLACGGEISIFIEQIS
jgi:xanthine/CO dehydrogenase XdhC/CoxF family maturation factor